jgi:aminopeptidase N
VLDLCLERAGNANMTLSYGALLALNDIESEQRERALAGFCKRWSHDSLVMDKWFALQAASAAPAGIERIRRLLRDEVSLNPNRVRAVLVTFWRENLRAFHHPDGSGYVLLGGEVERIDRHNPQLAAVLVEGLLGWRVSSAAQGEQQRSELLRLQRLNLSRDLREKIGKALEG